jgi:hypothetical protein
MMITALIAEQAMSALDPKIPSLPTEKPISGVTLPHAYHSGLTGKFPGQKIWSSPELSRESP